MNWLFAGWAAVVVLLPLLMVTLSEAKESLGCPPEFVSVFLSCVLPDHSVLKITIGEQLCINESV